MRTAAVLPVKRFESAKQRLGEAVGAAERRELATAMVADVLAALSQVGGLDEVIVVTAEDRAAALATAAGAHVVADRDETGQSRAAHVGVAAAWERRAERVLLVPGDCPALDPDEVTALLANHPGDGVVIVSDRHGEGTNALLIAPPRMLPPSFGPGSLARHAALARSAGARVRITRVPSLEHDVDTPDDLRALRALLAERPGAATRTRALLERLAPAAR